MGSSDDAGNPTTDARVVDATVNNTVDAGIDAPPSVPPTASQEITAGSKRMSGSTYEVEAQIGHPVSQKKMSGATYEVEGAAAVKP